MAARELLTSAELVVWDLDDTLFDQGSYLSANFAHLEGRSGIVGLAAALAAAAAAGSDRGDVIDAALASLGHTDSQLVAPLVCAFREFTPAALPLSPGAAAALGLCRRRWLLTDGSPLTQNAKIDALAIRHLFERVIISDVHGRRFRKPDPTLLGAALADACVSPDRVVIVGDRPGKEAALARKLNMRCVRVRTGEWAQHDCEPFPGLVEIRSLADLN